MDLRVTPLTKAFAARVDGVDLARPLDEGVLHRATPFDSARHKRLLQRTTISGDPAEPAA